MPWGPAGEGRPAPRSSGRSESVLRHNLRLGDIDTEAVRPGDQLMSGSPFDR
jgi:hypothetical protein